MVTWVERCADMAFFTAVRIAVAVLVWHCQTVKHIGRVENLLGLRICESLVNFDRRTDAREEGGVQRFLDDICVSEKCEAGRHVSDSET